MEQSEVDAINAVELTAQDEADIDEALRNARAPLDEQIASTVYYNAEHDLLMLTLKTGQRVLIPREDLQGLADVDSELVSKVEIEMLGLALHWEELDVDHLVDHLRRGIYGNERWMAEIMSRRRERAS